MTINLLRESICESSLLAKKLLWENNEYSRSDYSAKGKMPKSNAVVYAYFDEVGNCLYVGETSRRIKSRMHDERSPHKMAGWWCIWKTVRFIQVINRTDRLLLEFLLILALQPKCNSKPAAREILSMFAS